MHNEILIPVIVIFVILFLVGAWIMYEKLKVLKVYLVKCTLEKRRQEALDRPGLPAGWVPVIYKKDICENDLCQIV